MGPSAGLADGVLPPKGNCPAMTCSPGMRPDKLLHQNVVLFKLFPVSQAGRSSTGSLPQCHPSTSPTQPTGASTELQHLRARRSSPALCKFFISLFQNQRKHLLPGIPKWQECKIVLGLLQTSKWFVCTSDPCGRRKGKDEKKRFGQR